MDTSSAPPIRILLVDDHELFRTGIANLLNAQPDMQVVGEAGDGLEAHYRAVAFKPDLILLDVNMPGVDGIEALSVIKAELPDTTVIMLTVHDEDEKVFSAIRAGAQGYLLKNTGSVDFLRMLRGAMRGEAALSPKLASRILAEFARLSESKTEATADDLRASTLTAREKEVLTFVSEGLTDKEIAVRLSLSIHTVKSHMRNILAKLHVANRYEAADYARHRGLTSP
jgi:two-component system NarL family response regulator